MKSAAAPLLALCLFVLRSPCPAGEYPVDQWKAWLARSGDRYPQASWLAYAEPEEAGWSSEGLREARAYFDSLNSAAVMAVYDGAVLAAWGDVERRFMCHSVRKSLLSALFGVHVAEGRLDLNETLAELGIDDEPPLTDAERRARVVDLLASRSGVYHPAAYETAKMKERRPARGSHAPGERFWYNNWDFNALCTIFERETGTKVFEEFARRFADPLGMEDYRLQDTYYHLEAQHSVHPAYPFRMSARDLARFGLLYLRRGQWEGRRILTPEWVETSTASHFREGDTTSNARYAYGYLWWRIVDGPFADLGMFSARGYGGHAIDVLPAADLVFVHRVDTFWDGSLPFGRERKRVKDSERFRLLELMLRARTGPPRPEPELAPLAASAPPVEFVRLEADALSKYAGEYDFGEFTLRVRVVGDSLRIGRPGRGEFGLLPRSAHEFTVEDLDAPVVFQRDADAGPLRMIAEFAPGKRVTAERRVQGD
jgi:CubicO group peptidase (beta-lactamase class C family)